MPRTLRSFQKAGSKKDFRCASKIGMPKYIRSTTGNRDPLGTAVSMLLHAHWYAKGARCNRWQFAIEIEEFHRVGVTNSELRWLNMTGLALNAVEISDSKSPYREFTSTSNHSLPAGTCMVLSDRGIAQFAGRSNPTDSLTLLKHSPPHFGQADPSEQPLPATVAEQQLIPNWDHQQKELRLDGVLVRHYRNSAPNQELILRAFQEEAWRRRIDDPLPPASEQDSRRRLSDTIKYLNRNQLNELIRFRGDGTGRGVTWELRLE